jgi:hypothetical protein
MGQATGARELFEALHDVPVIDIHTHLVGGKLGARGLHDVLLYHMAVSDLYAAGCPSGERLTQFPQWPSREESTRRIREALPYLHYVSNTSTNWGVRIILRELFNWDDVVDESNWVRLDDAVRERANDRSWHRDVMRRANIVRFGTEIARRERGEDDDILHYALEWAFFTRCQWGEYDTALYELEKCWGKTPESPTPIGAGQRYQPERTIKSLDDVHAAIDHYVRTIPADRILSTATHVSMDLDLRVVSDTEMSSAITRRDSAGPAERDIYASYIHEAFLAAFSRHASRVVFQFSFGAEPLPFETGSRLSQKAIAQLGEMAARHPDVRFQCFLSSAHANQSMCTLCRELPNVSLAGYWWHNFFPSIIRRVMNERLDMLPWNKQIGFFSDAYVIEWAYAKLKIVRWELAQALAERIESGQFNRDEAISYARKTMYLCPQELNEMTPASGGLGLR